LPRHQHEADTVDQRVAFGTKPSKAIHRLGASSYYRPERVEHVQAFADPSEARQKGRAERPRRSRNQRTKED
jgi:hypothetical protein